MDGAAEYAGLSELTAAGPAVNGHCSRQVEGARSLFAFYIRLIGSVCTLLRGCQPPCPFVHSLPGAATPTVAAQLLSEYSGGSCHDCSAYLALFEF